MDMQEAAFTVTLCDYPNLPEQERNKAEARYARVLERQLGSAEQVSETLYLVEGLEDTPPEEISDDAKLAFARWMKAARAARSEEHTSELQSQSNLVCRLLLEKKNKTTY